MGVHGNHWECLPDKVENIIPKIIPLTINSGKIIGQVKVIVDLPEFGGQSEETIFAITHPQGALTSLVLIMSNGKKGQNLLWSAYPVGYTDTIYEIEINEIHDWDNYAEGQIEGTVFGGPLLSFFDTFYFQNKVKYSLGRKHKFALAGFAYTITKYDHQELEIDRPELGKLLNPGNAIPSPIKISFDGAKLLIPFSNGDRDDYSFQTTIEELEPVDFLDYAMFRIKGTFINFEDQFFNLDVYAGKHIFKDGYIPKVGDEIRGNLWLQGRLVDNLLSGKIGGI